MGKLPLDAVHARPRRHQGQDPGHQIHQGAGGVTLVSPGFPELVEPGAADHQRGVELHPVGAERGVLEKFLEKKKNKKGEKK